MEIKSIKNRIKLAYNLLKTGYIKDELVGNYVEGRSCTVPENFLDAFYDCNARNHPEWFSDNKRYQRYGHHEDCQVCKWNTKPIKFVQAIK